MDKLNPLQQAYRFTVYIYLKVLHMTLCERKWLDTFFRMSMKNKLLWKNQSFISL